MKETSPDLVDRKVVLVALVQKSRVVPYGQGCLDLDHLTIDLLPDGVSVRPLAFPASRPQPALKHPDA